MLRIKRKVLSWETEILVGTTFQRNVLRNILVLNFFKKLFPNGRSKILLMQYVK